VRDPVLGISRHIRTLGEDNAARLGFAGTHEYVMVHLDLDWFFFNDPVRVIIYINVAGNFTDFPAGGVVYLYGKPDHVIINLLDYQITDLDGFLC